MHHIHMSAGFLFIVGMLALGLIAIIFTAFAVARRDRLAAEASKDRRDLATLMKNIEPQPTPFADRLVNRPSPWASRPVEPSAADVKVMEQRYVSPPPVQHYAPVAAAAPVYAHDPMTGLMTGMLIGNALGSSHHNHDTTTIIHDSSPSYSAPASSSYDSGFSYDSGSSSAYDSGSSSGFDASW